MRSRPLPLLPFDCVGAEQLEWDGASGDITAATPVAQSFRCADDGLHRVEIFLEPTFHFTRCHLWLFLFEGAATAKRGTSVPLRIAGPLASEQLTAHGWFAFEFEPVARSAMRRFTVVLQSPDGAPGNALRIRTSTRTPAAADQPDAALTFRAACLQAPALLPNFQHYRRYAHERSGRIEHHPLIARLEISRPCNLHCIMCQRGLHPFDPRRESPGFMSLETAQALDPILPTLLRVIALGLGEPFLNPQFLDILRHVRSRNAFAHVFTSTNGTRLGDDAIDAILDEHLLSELQISLDGAERGTFERIRRNASFDVVLGAFERSAAARARRRNPTLNLTAAMLVMRPNFAQVLPFVQRMAGLGVDRISLDSPKDAAFKPLRADGDDEMKRIFEQVSCAAEYLADTDTALSGPLLSELLVWHRQTHQPGSPPRWGADECAHLAPPPGARATACTVPWESFTLAADGAVTVCCNSIRQMGHVREAGIAAAWSRGAAYGQLRDELVTRSLHRDCASCLGENFVVPGEATPVIYAGGCLADRGHTTRFAQTLGCAIDALELEPATDLRAEIDPATWRAGAVSTAGWVLRGNLEIIGRDEFGTPTDGSPILVAIVVRGIVQALAAATRVTRTLTQWSAVIPAVTQPAKLEDVQVLLVEGTAFRKAILRETPRISSRFNPSTQLHGFVDEVTRIGDRIHVRGWARDGASRGPAGRVAVLLGGDTLTSVAPWLPRPDIARAFGDSLTIFGYTLELPLADLAANEAQPVTVIALDQTGAAAPLEWSEPAAATLRSLTVPRRFRVFRKFRLAPPRTSPAAAVVRVSPDPACSTPATAWS